MGAYGLTSLKFSNLWESSGSAVVTFIYPPENTLGMGTFWERVKVSLRLPVARAGMTSGIRIPPDMRTFVRLRQRPAPQGCG